MNFIATIIPSDTTVIPSEARDLSALSLPEAPTSKTSAAEPSPFAHQGSN
jgi:hypothetical protein